jgi:hypothetical protein
MDKWRKENLGTNWHHTYSENTCTPSSTPRNFYFKNMLYIKNIIFCEISSPPPSRINMLVVSLSNSTFCSIIKVENQGKSTCMFSFTECTYSLQLEKESKLRNRTLRNQNNNNAIANTPGFKRKAKRMTLFDCSI